MPITKPSHPDVELARELLRARRTLTGQVRPWNWILRDELKALVERNERFGSPLGREAYILMRDVWWSLEPLLRAEDRARKYLLGVDYDRERHGRYVQDDFTGPDE